MNRVDVLWDLLERADWPGKTPGQVTWRDVDVWEHGTIEWLQGLGLIREVAAADVAACNECLDVHIERVHHRRRPGGELLASIPCPVNGEVRLDSDTLRRWQIDLPGFAAKLARDCLETGRVREVIHQRCWQLGVRDGKATFLVRGPLWPDAAVVFSGASTFPRNSRLLHLSQLSPSFKPNATEWYPLSQVFQTDDLRLDLDSIDDLEEPAFEMQRVGRIWILRFETGRAAPVPDLKGFSYLRILLSAPGREFTALELASPGFGVNLRSKPSDALEELSPVDGFSTEQVMDTEYREQIQARISELAAKKNTRGLSGEDDQELKDLRQRLKAATSIDGRSRRTPREGERARVAITNAISRAIDETSKALPEMAAHLRAHIKTGSFFSYEGDEVVSWSLVEDSAVTSPVTE
jgi:hypothetical protein